MRTRIILIALLGFCVNSVLAQSLYDVFQIVNSRFDKDTVCYQYKKNIDYYQNQELVKSELVEGQFFKRGAIFLNKYDNVKVFGDSSLLCLYVQEDNVAVVQENNGKELLSGEAFNSNAYKEFLESYESWNIDTVSGSIIIDIYMDINTRLQMIVSDDKSDSILFKVYQEVDDFKIISEMKFEKMPLESIHILSDYDIDLNGTNAKAELHRLLGTEVDILFTN